MGWFVILSNCNFSAYQNQEIFTYALTKRTFSPRLPLSSLDRVKNICAFIGEILVLSHERVYGISIGDDLNYWSVPYTQMNIDINRASLTCLESQNAAILIGYIPGTNQRTTVFIRGNSGSRQDRRYPHVLSGLSSNRIHTYDFLNSIFMSSEQDGDVGFIQSYLDPVV